MRPSCARPSDYPEPRHQSHCRGVEDENQLAFLNATAATTGRATCSANRPSPRPSSSWSGASRLHEARRPAVGPPFPAPPLHSYCPLAGSSVGRMARASFAPGANGHFHARADVLFCKQASNSSIPDTGLPSHATINRRPPGRRLLPGFRLHRHHPHTAFAGKSKAHDAPKRRILSRDSNDLATCPWRSADHHPWRYRRR